MDMGKSIIGLSVRVERMEYGIVAHNHETEKFYGIECYMRKI